MNRGRKHIAYKPNVDKVKEKTSVVTSHDIMGFHVDVLKSSR